MYFKLLRLGTIGFDAIDNQNIHVEINGDNPSEKKQSVFIQNLLWQRNHLYHLCLTETRRQTGE